MRTQASAAAKPATRSRKPAATKKAASAAKAPAKAKAKSAAKAKSKSTTKANGVAMAAKTTSNRGTRSAAGSKSQAGKAGKSQQRRSGGTRKPSQQSGAAPQRQGAGTMSPPAQAPMFGGTRQVLIEEVAMSNRGGRKQGPEPFPFGDLTPSRLEGGAILGPSFFIPESENPKRIIAAGRKRHKGVGKVFLTRQMEGPSTADANVKVSGTRVWLAPEGYNE